MFRFLLQVGTVIVLILLDKTSMRVYESNIFKLSVFAQTDIVGNEHNTISTYCIFKWNVWES